MPQPPGGGSDTQLQNFIDRARNGDPTANDALLKHASDRLLRLTRKMFHGYRKLARWEETADVFQNAMYRLDRALEKVQVTSVQDFFSLAARQIRWELLDLVKHHFGPEGWGANYHTDGQPADDEGGMLHKPLDNIDEPEDMQGWSDFHTQVSKLPPDELAVIDHVFYHGLTQEKAAEVLGISLRTLKRRWLSAKLRLRGIEP